jgi:hypothetical protein
MFIPDPNFSISDPGSRVKKIPDPGSASQNLSIFNPRNPDLDFFPSRIRWSNAPDTGSATLAVGGGSVYIRRYRSVGLYAVNKT